MKRDIKLTCSTHPVTVPGDVFGDFAVVRFYAPIEEDRPYSVTHIPSGLCAARTRTKKHAVHIARRLRDVPVEWGKVTGMIDWATVSKRNQRLLSKIRLDALLA